MIETSNAYARGLLQGVVHYIREHRPWSFHLMEQGRGDDPPPWLAGWKGDGIIARIETPRIARAVVRTGLPAVDLSAARLVPTLPWVETNDEEIARLAAAACGSSPAAGLSGASDRVFRKRAAPPTPIVRAASAVTPRPAPPRRHSAA